MEKTKHLLCPLCLHDCDACQEAIIGLPCGHTYHLRCVCDQKSDWSIPFCEATERCCAATRQAKVLEQVKRMRWEGNVQVIPREAIHNWLPTALRQHTDIEREAQELYSTRASWWQWWIGALARPLLSYSDLERDISVHSNGDILRQLDDGVRLSHLRGRNNQRINSLYLLMHSIPTSSQGAFFQSLKGTTVFYDLGALRANNECGAYLLNILKVLGVTAQTIKSLGTIADFAHVFNITYQLFYTKVCDGDIRTLETLSPSEKDFNALKARAKDIVASAGFSVITVENLTKLTMHTWHRLGATVGLFRTIPMSKRAALHCWTGLYSSSSACEHAFHEIFGADMSALDVAVAPAATAVPSTIAVDGKPLDGQPPEPTSLSPLPTLAATTLATGERAI